MYARSKGITAEVPEPQKRRKAHAAHTASNRALLSCKAIRKNALITRKMQLRVARGIVGFLKNGDEIDAASVQIGVVSGV